MLLLMTALNSSGVLPTGSEPIPTNWSRLSGERAILAISADSHPPDFAALARRAHGHDTFRQFPHRRKARR